MRIIIFLLSISLLFAPLVSAQNTGDIHLYCKPKVKVYLDGSYFAKTNEIDSGVFINNVLLGKHKLRIKKRGQSDEVLIFSIYKPNKDLESKRFAIGKFTEDVRNSKFMIEVPSYRFFNLYEKVFEEDTLSEIAIMRKWYKSLAVDNYIPFINEEYEIDSIPVRLFKLPSVSPLIDTSLFHLHENETVVQCLIDTNGSVATVVIDKSSGSEEVDNMAVTFVYRGRFFPAVKNHKRAWTWMKLTIPYSVLAMDNPDVNQLVAMMKNYIKNDTTSTINEQPDSHIYADDNRIVDNFPNPDEFVAVDTMPEMIATQTPTYPRLAKQRGYEGVVMVKALIDKNGIVLKAMVAKTSGKKVLDKAAIEAAFGNKFKPGIQNGKPITVWVTYNVDFKLDKTNAIIPNNFPDEKNKTKSNDYLPSHDEFIPVDILPEMVYSKAPIYPKEEQFKGITGTVLVKVLVSNKGKVLKVLIAKSSGNKQLDNAALDAAPKNKFKPAIQNGKPIALWVSYKVDFKMDR